MNRFGGQLVPRRAHRIDPKTKQNDTFRVRDVAVIRLLRDQVEPIRLDVTVQNAGYADAESLVDRAPFQFLDQALCLGLNGVDHGLVQGLERRADGSGGRAACQDDSRCPYRAACGFTGRVGMQ